MAKWNPFRRSETKSTTEDAGAGQTPAVDASGDSPSDATGGQASAPASGGANAAENRGGSIMGRFRTALQKTVRVLNTDIRDLVGKEGRLVDDEFLAELYAHLVKTDMGAGPAGEIRDQIQRQFRGRKVHMSDLVDSAKATIRDLMQQPETPIEFTAEGPTVVMVVVPPDGMDIWPSILGAADTPPVASPRTQIIHEYALALPLISTSTISSIWYSI